MAFVGTLAIAPCVSFFKYTQTKLELRQNFFKNTSYKHIIFNHLIVFFYFLTLFRICNSEIHGWGVAPQPVFCPGTANPVPLGFRIENPKERGSNSQRATCLCISIDYSNLKTYCCKHFYQTHSQLQKNIKLYF